MLIRHKELADLMHDLNLTIPKAIRLLKQLGEPLSEQELDDYLKGRRQCPGWLLSRLEWELANPKTLAYK